MKKRASVIGLYNRKGGAGKTTSCINIGASLAYMGYHVLLIDSDSQHNLTNFFFATDRSVMEYGSVKPNVPTIVEVLSKEADIAEVVRTVTYHFKRKENNRMVQKSLSLDVIMSSQTISDMAPEENDDKHEIYKLIDPLREKYDYILIDFPPEMGLLPITFMFACDYILSPVELSNSDGRLGYLQVLNIVLSFKETGPYPCPDALGMFYTKGAPYKKWQKDMLEEDLKNQVLRAFNTMIRDDITAVSKASSYAMQPLCVCEPRSKSAIDYMKLTEELINRINDRQNQ